MCIRDSVYRDYEKAMKKACALDFDDIIMKTVLLLQNNPEVLEYYQRQFRYCLLYTSRCV